jgi:hypothetical protein
MFKRKKLSILVSGAFLAMAGILQATEATRHE